MTKFHRHLPGVLVAAALTAAAIAGSWLVPAQSQPVPSTVGPYNVDLGLNGAPVITNTARPAGTTTSAIIANLDQSGIVCTFAQTAVSGSPSTTFTIQGFDAATATWNTLGTSSADTTDTTGNPYTVWIQPGLIAADVPTNGVGKSLHAPRQLRIQQTVGGSGGPGTTSKIGCNILK